MMMIDTPESFKVLKHYGLHAARVAFVDSPEAAIAFAERRDARDPRFMPITLRHGALAAASPELETEHAIRRAFEHVASAGEDRKIVAQEVTPAGTDMVVSGRTDPDGGKHVEVGPATQRVGRMVPLDTASAEFLTTHVQGFHHRGSGEARRRMIEHVLLRISTLFGDAGVSDFDLTIRLHENSYTVVDAWMKAPAPLHLKERLDPHAHDRKAEDYHPAGIE